MEDRGRLGDVSFCWGLLQSGMESFDTTTRELQEDRLRRALSRMKVLDERDGLSSRRLLAATQYFHIACRLAHAPGQRWEYLSECLLNYAKVLESELRDVNAQKGMLISPSGFQSGALEFAAAKHIATVTVVQGKWLYQTRAAGGGPVEPPPWVHFDPVAGILMSKTETGVTRHTIEMDHVDALVEWLAKPGVADVES